MIKISKAALMHPLRKWKIPHVVYFDQLSGAACTRKLVKTFFSAVFQPFLFISKLFQWFHGWNQVQKSSSENEQKNSCFCLILKAGRHSKAGRLPEGIPQISLFRLIFQTFFSDFSSETTVTALKWTKKVEKWLKKVTTSFWVPAAPKSWSKYTTQGYMMLMLPSVPLCLGLIFMLFCVPFYCGTIKDSLYW